MLRIKNFLNVYLNIYKTLEKTGQIQNKRKTAIWLLKFMIHAIFSCHEKKEEISVKIQRLDDMIMSKDKFSKFINSY